MLTSFAVTAVVAVIAVSVILMVGPEWFWSFFGPTPAYYGKIAIHPVRFLVCPSW